MRAADSAGAAPKRYLPVIDHAGTGSLMATLSDNGEVVERVLYADSYGDAPRYLQGPIVDKVTLEAKKHGSGNLQSVIVPRAPRRANRRGQRGGIDAPGLGDEQSIDCVRYRR